MSTWDTTVDATVQASLLEGLKRRQNLQQSLTQPCGVGASGDLDSNWCRGVEAPRLSEMLTQAVAIAAAEQSSQHRTMSAGLSASDLPCPQLSLARCTHDDPWFYLFTIDAEFEEDERLAKSNYENLPEHL